MHRSKLFSKEVILFEEVRLCPRTRPFTEILFFGSSFSLVLKGTGFSSSTVKALSSLQQVACLLKHRRGCFYYFSFMQQSPGYACFLLGNL